jgi:hypothetical protein
MDFCAGYQNLVWINGKVPLYVLRVFENRVLRRIFGRKRDEITGEWRKLHSGELRNLCTSPDIIR